MIHWSLALRETPLIQNKCARARLSGFLDVVTSLISVIAQKNAKQMPATSLNIKEMPNSHIATKSRQLTASTAGDLARLGSFDRTLRRFDTRLRHMHSCCEVGSPINLPVRVSLLSTCCAIYSSPRVAIVARRPDRFGVAFCWRP